MNKKEKSYLNLLLFHAGIGLLVFVLPFLSKIYCLAIFGYGMYRIIKSQNKNNEALLFSAYVVGVEVLLRMTDGMFFNEYAKYSVMIFLFVGIFFTGFSKNAYWYLLFLVLLVPGVVLGTEILDYQTDIRKAIAFNISGPACLGVAAIYCYQRKISFESVIAILTTLSFPLVAMLVYLFLYNPSVKDVITGTQSNFETSGGFGPNQVATLLGLGFFIFFVKLLLHSKNNIIQFVNASLVLAFVFRAIVTFSRGGVITAIAMIIVFMVLLYFRANANVKPKIAIVVFASFLALLGVWTYTSVQTSGLIEKRYANKDGLGRKKKSQLSGREVLIETELNMFVTHPIFGVGVGKNKEYRRISTGINLATHNEITRMLAEHGLFGIFGLLILLIIPLVLYFFDTKNILAIPFFIFWLLTINHAAMRLAAPAFVYALSLLKVFYEPNKRKNTVAKI
jgi:O-antigen ligase